MTSTRNLQNITLSCIISFFIICLIAFPEKYIASVYNGLILFATSVAPALFPFFFFTKLLTALGGATFLGKIFSKPMRKLYNAHGCSGYIYVMSILSGYPVGSRLIADMYEHNIISAKEAAKISTFTSTSGPLFVVGTVATVMFHDTKIGYIILLCHMIGALLNGFIYRGKTEKTQRDKPTFLPISADNQDDILGKSVTSSIMSILVVGAYIAIFSMIIDVFIDFGVIDFLSRPLEKFLILLNKSPDCAKGIVISCVEITRGCQELSQHVDIKEALPFVAGLLSFGGLAITCQSMTFLSKCKIKFSYFLLSKTTQSIITFAIAYGVSLIL